MAQMNYRQIKVRLKEAMLLLEQAKACEDPWQADAKLKEADALVRPCAFRGGRLGHQAYALISGTCFKIAVEKGLIKPGLEVPSKEAEDAPQPEPPPDSGGTSPLHPPL